MPVSRLDFHESIFRESTPRRRSDSMGQFPYLHVGQMTSAFCFLHSFRERPWLFFPCQDPILRKQWHWHRAVPPFQAHTLFCLRPLHAAGKDFRGATLGCGVREDTGRWIRVRSGLKPQSEDMWRMTCTCVLYSTRCSHICRSER